MAETKNKNKEKKNQLVTTHANAFKGASFDDVFNMVVKYKGKADLKKTCKILADNMERYPLPTEIVDKPKPVIVIYPAINKTYKHYKGGTYKVITMAKHSETDEDLVIYQNVERSSFHARPLRMWFEEIKGLGTKNKPVIRFTEIKTRKK